MLLFKFIQNLYMGYQLKRTIKAKIKLANDIRNTSGHKCFVFRWKNQIVVKKKQSIKAMMARKEIKRINLRDFEKMCIYVTH